MAPSLCGADVFDRVAATVAHQVAKAWFFTCCVLLVVLWAPSYFLIGDVEVWQLLINSATTIITFLLVALLQNTQERFEQLTMKQNEILLERLEILLDRLEEVSS